MATSAQISKIASDINICIPIVKMLMGLSGPARHALRIYLINIKRELQATLATYSFKNRIAARKHQEILKVYAKTGATLSQAKRVLNLLNIGPEFQDEPCIQKLINTLTVGGKVKGLSLSGYQDVNNLVNALNIGAHQAARAVDFGENVVKTVNYKIDIVDKYIAVLKAVDTLGQ